MADTTLALDPAALAPWYQGADQPEVVRFLEAHPFLAPLLAEAVPHLEQHFPGATLWLEVSYDPETGSDPDLVLVISPTTPPAEALAAYERFKQAWWLWTHQRSRCQLVILLEYR